MNIGSIASFTYALFWIAIIWIFAFAPPFDFAEYVVTDPEVTGSLLQLALLGGLGVLCMGTYDAAGTFAEIFIEKWTSWRGKKRNSE